MTLPELDAQHLAAAALVAVAGFWVLGAYNRLVSLRNDIAQAWARVDEALRQRGDTAGPLVSALREPLAAEQGALDRLLHTHAEAARAAGAMSARPADAALATAWVAAETALAAGSSRVFALIEQQPALREPSAAAGPDEPPSVAALLAVWRDSEARLGFARALFNDASQRYNEAIALFPTSVLVRLLFRFQPAGQL